MHMQEFGSRSSPVLESISKSLGIPSTLKHPVPPNQNAWLQLEQQIIHNASSSWMGQGHNRSHEWKSGQGCTWIWSHTSFTSCMLSHSRCVWLFVTLWIVAHQAPLSMGFFSKNTGVGCHALLRGILLTQGSNLQKGVCQGYKLLSSYLNEMQNTSFKMPGYMKHRLKSSDMQMTTL